MEMASLATFASAQRGTARNVRQRSKRDCSGRVGLGRDREREEGQMGGDCREGGVKRRLERIDRVLGMPLLV